MQSSAINKLKSCIIWFQFILCGRCSCAVLTEGKYKLSVQGAADCCLHIEILQEAPSELGSSVIAFAVLLFIL